MEPSSQPPLRDENLIQERKNPYPFWLWLALAAMAAALFWGMGNWFNHGINARISDSPFLQVTNRQISLFLWQFPEYMRINAPMKEGYLPAFQYQRGQIGPTLDQVDNYAIAPPDVLFLYHTWARLLKPEAILRSFSWAELREFLQYAPEWQPENWPGAPPSYRSLMARIPQLSKEDLSKNVPALPADVQIAITGWKNYFQEGGIIDRIAPTYRQISNFIERYPFYARNYWRNIVINNRPHYLETFSTGKYQPESAVPPEQLTAFLKVALYNDQQALAESKK